MRRLGARGSHFMVFSLPRPVEAIVCLLSYRSPSTARKRAGAPSSKIMRHPLRFNTISTNSSPFHAKNSSVKCATNFTSTLASWVVGPTKVIVCCCPPSNCSSRCPPRYQFIDKQRGMIHARAPPETVNSQPYRVSRKLRNRQTRPETFRRSKSAFGILQPKVWEQRASATFNLMLAVESATLPRQSILPSPERRP